MTIGGGSPGAGAGRRLAVRSDLERGRRDGTMRRPRRAGEDGARGRPDRLPAGRHGRGDRPRPRTAGTWTWTTRSCAGRTSRTSATARPAPRRATPSNLAAIACGGREAIERTPAVMGVVNPNSPLVWDRLMVDALTEWASANQPVIVTPFLLAGATAPVSVAAGLVAGGGRGAVRRRPDPGDPAGRRRACSARSSPPSTCAAARPPWARRSRCSARSPAGSWPATTGCPTAAAAACARGLAMDAQAASETLMTLWATMLAALGLRAARLRLAGGRPGRVVREVRVRPRGAADVPDRRRRVRGRRRGARAGRRARRGPGRHVPGQRPHAGPLQGVVVHEPAVPRAVLRDVAEAGRAAPRTSSR